MMLISSFYQDQRDFWVWEVLDEDGVYLRSERAFSNEFDARDDLKVSTHLIQDQFHLN